MKLPAKNIATQRNIFFYILIQNLCFLYSAPFIPSRKFSKYVFFEAGLIKDFVKSVW